MTASTAAEQLKDLMPQILDLMMHPEVSEFDDVVWPVLQRQAFKQRSVRDALSTYQQYVRDKQQGRMP